MLFVRGRKQGAGLWQDWGRKPLNWSASDVMDKCTLAYDFMEAKKGKRYIYTD